MNPHHVTKEFERELCKYTGAPYAVAVTSCSMALLLAVAYHFRDRQHGDNLSVVEIPKRTYVGVPYAIVAAGAWPKFRDEEWRGAYQLKPLPVWDSARYFTSDLFDRVAREHREEQMGSGFVCVSFHWSKTLGVQQGGAILHDDPEADEWLRRARFDGRAEGVAPIEDTFSLPQAWHCYLSPEVSAAALMRLSLLPKDNAPLQNDDYPDLSQLEVFR